jgi:hypothetical protein
VEPVGYGLKLSKFRNDVAAGKDRALLHFPSLQNLIDSEVNERRLRESLVNIVRARDDRALRPIADRKGPKRRQKPRNWKKVAVQFALEDTLRGAAERAGTTLSSESFDLFLQLLNQHFLPREFNLGTAQAARDARRNRVRH